MSLPQATIEQLRADLEKERTEKRKWLTQLDRANEIIDRLTDSLDRQNNLYNGLLELISEALDRPGKKGILLDRVLVERIYIQLKQESENEVRNGQL